MFEKYKQLVSDLEIENNQIRDPENYHNASKRTFFHNGIECSFEPIYDGFVPEVLNTLTIDGLIKPRERLTVPQLNYFMRNDFKELLFRHKVQDTFFKLGQALLVLFALLGFVELIIWIV